MTTGPDVTLLKDGFESGNTGAWGGSFQDPEARMQSIRGQVALVTGGSRGVGRVSLRASTRAGAVVYVTGRTVDQAELGGASCIPVPCDHTDDEQVRAVFDRRTSILICPMSPAEAATLAALIVPMPVLNQWKVKNKFTFRSLTAEELAPAFEYLRNNVPGDDPTTSAGYLNPWLVGGKSNRIDPESAVMPVRECAVMWIHAGAQWNDPNVESQALAFVDGLWKALEFNPDSSTALYGCSDIQLGSQLTNPPDFSYLQAYWSSPTHDFVDFLMGVKNKHDPCDLFKFAQSIPLAL